MTDNRNNSAIFAPSAPQTPAQTAQTYKESFGYDIPIEEIGLPSGGLTYSGTLAGRKSLQIKALTSREEDILTSKTLLKNGTAITEVIKSCLIDKSVNVNELLIGDRNALMIAIRITGYGQEYDAEIVCPDSSCATKNKFTFDLAQLPMKTLDVEPVAPATNAFDFHLPISKKRITFKLLTTADETEIIAEAERNKKMKLSSDSNVTTNLLKTIIAIDGITDRNKIAQFSRNMLARDSLALREYMSKIDPGVEMKQEFTCSTCGYSEEVVVPMGVTFFWPNAK